MHVSQLRPLPVPMTAQVDAQAARKKRADDPDKVPPVERRFEDDAPQRQARHQTDEDETPPAPEDEEAVAAKGFQLAANAPPVVADVHIAEPLDALLTEITGHPSGQAEPEVAQDTQPSLNDLLTAMRTTK